MPSNPLSSDSKTFPDKTLADTLDGQPVSNDVLLDQIAAELYHVASMILGEGEDTVRIVEEAVTQLDLTSAGNQDRIRHDARLAVAGEAVALLGQRNPADFVAPGENAGPVSCIEDDELDAAGVSRAELERMLTGPDQQHLRGWLEGLSVSLRVIFVLRAVAGLSSGEIAGVLGEHGGAQAQDWTPDAVRTEFRQGLCSLASQLLHASNAM
jgi:hypothetical protein